MLSFLSMLKNYAIDSEEDIPVEYREEIEQKLSNEPKELQFGATQFTPGINGAILSEDNEIKEAFSDNSVYYFGHGTSRDETILKSILQNGLKTINPRQARFYGNTLRGLDSTTIVFGSGDSHLFEKEKEKLDNWPHNDSRNIVIISLPKEYVLRIMDIGTFADPYKPFYVGSEEHGFNLRPEFIRGIYNAETHSFTENSNFYQNLDETTQKSLFEDVKISYIKSYAEFSNVNPRKTSEPLPLNAYEMERISIEWYKEQLKKLREDKILNNSNLDQDKHDIANEMTKTNFQDGMHFVEDPARNSKKDKLNEDDIEWEI